MDGYKATKSKHNYDIASNKERGNKVGEVIEPLNYSFMRPIYFLTISSALIFFLSLTAFCQTDSTQGRIELKASVDQSQVPLNQKLTFTVEASWEGEQNRFSITPVVPPQCDNFEIFGSSSLNESKIEAGKSKSLKIFKFILKPTQTGAGRIGSVLVNYIDNLTQDSSSLSTQPINVKITPPVETSETSYKIILGIAIVLIFIYVIYSAKRKIKRIEITKEKGIEVEQKQETLEEKTLKRLDEISEQVQKGELYGLPSGVYKLLTDYLEAKYQIATSGKTTNDIVSSLSSLELSSQKISLLKDVFTTCDLAKFAGEKMEKWKCEDMINKVRKFLEQNS